MQGRMRSGEGLLVFVEGGKEDGGRCTQTTSSFGSMSLLSRIAARTAEPSLPVALVRAIISNCVVESSCLKG